VREALDDREASVIAKSIVNSPLIKTMVHGADPNVGRCDGGRQVLRLHDPSVVDLGIDQRIPVVAGRASRVRRRRSYAKRCHARKWTSSVHVGVGERFARAYGCDLTKGYVDENAAYYSS
jgi:glutamate N-acetyltransferase/amino-acid N-acetyltransferase